MNQSTVKSYYIKKLITLTLCILYVNRLTSIMKNHNRDVYKRQKLFLRVRICRSDSTCLMTPYQHADGKKYFILRDEVLKQFTSVSPNMLVSGTGRLEICYRICLFWPRTCRRICTLFPSDTFLILSPLYPGRAHGGIHFVYVARPYADDCETTIGVSIR